MSEYEEKTIHQVNLNLGKLSPSPIKMGVKESIRTVALTPPPPPGLSTGSYSWPLNRKLLLLTLAFQPEVIQVSLGAIAYTTKCNVSNQKWSNIQRGWIQQNERFFFIVQFSPLPFRKRTWGDCAGWSETISDLEIINVPNLWKFCWKKGEDSRWAWGVGGGARSFFFFFHPVPNPLCLDCLHFAELLIHLILK